MGSEMCIRDSFRQIVAVVDIGEVMLVVMVLKRLLRHVGAERIIGCLLYTSDAADERSSVDLGGRRIIKKKKKEIRDEYADA